MRFQWKKLGKVFEAKGQHPWMQNYTTPIAALVLPSCIRVYFSARATPDQNGNFISNASFVDVDKDNPTQVLYVHDKPLIPLGGPGMFDEFGVMTAKPAVFGDKVYFYYMGWQRLSGETVPYQVMLGLAISDDQGRTFTKISNGPILGIDRIDPLSIGNVSVIIENGVWKMWYTTFTKWAIGGQKPTPVYNIKYATSKNGIDWKKEDYVAIDENEEGGVATPSVIKINGVYHMWFGCRPPYDKNGNVSGYSIGYAHSQDGLEWKREDRLSGIFASEGGWDSEMVCYPHVVKSGDRLFMFYCGNGFGRSGFGCAESM